MAATSLDEETFKNVLRQVEFYLRDSNLPSDKFLSKCVAESEDGKPDTVPEDVVMAVAEVLRNSTVLKVSEDGRKIGRSTELLKPEELIEQLDVRTIAALPSEHDVNREDLETYFSQFGKVNSVRLPRHVANKKVFCGTTLVEFSTEEDAKQILERSLVYAGANLDLKPNYPKGLIVSFKIKSMSYESSVEGNGANEQLNDIEDSKESTEDVKKDNKDEAILKENVDGKNNEGEGKGTGNGGKSYESPIAESEEKEEKSTAIAYKDNKNVVLREDLKGVFQKFGFVKFIVFKIGDESGFVRFEESEAAQKARAAAVLAEQGGLLVKNYIATLEPLTGEEEKQYWSLLCGNQDRCRENKGNRGGRGGKYFKGGRHARSRENDYGSSRSNKSQKFGST